MKNLITFTMFLFVFLSSTSCEEKNIVNSSIGESYTADYELMQEDSMCALCIQECCCKVQIIYPLDGDQGFKKIRICGVNSPSGICDDEDDRNCFPSSSWADKGKDFVESFRPKTYCLDKFNRILVANELNNSVIVGITCIYENAVSPQIILTLGPSGSVNDREVIMLGGNCSPGILSCF